MTPEARAFFNEAKTSLKNARVERLRLVSAIRSGRIRLSARMARYLGAQSVEEEREPDSGQKVGRPAEAARDVAPWPGVRKRLNRNTATAGPAYFGQGTAEPAYRAVDHYV